jgi:hypothetical protein
MAQVVHLESILCVGASHLRWSGLGALVSFYCVLEPELSSPCYRELVLSLTRTWLGYAV